MKSSLYVTCSALLRTRRRSCKGPLLCVGHGPSGPYVGPCGTGGPCAARTAPCGGPCGAGGGVGRGPGRTATWGPYRPCGPGTGGTAVPGRPCRGSPCGRRYGAGAGPWARSCPRPRGGGRGAGAWGRGARPHSGPVRVLCWGPRGPGSPLSRLRTSPSPRPSTCCKETNLRTWLISACTKLSTSFILSLGLFGIGFSFAL